MEAAESWRTYATMCRLCLQKDGFMLGIFNNVQGKDKSIYKKIVDCTALQISQGDGLPNVVCHRCLYKIEFCLEFRHLCFMSDAALRQLGAVASKDRGTEGQLPIPVYEQLANVSESDVVMVVDPNALDYESECESENEGHSDTDNLDNSEVPEPEVNKNVIMCRYCDQAFTDQNECKEHELGAHNQAIPYACSQCSMGFADRLQYSAHLKSVHQNDKPYNCPQCERTFARRSDLRKHTIVHTGVKPFTCHVCFKSFSRNTNLSKHLRIHSGQKPFICRRCPKSFFSKMDLQRHSLIHAGQRQFSMQKPFSCNYCHLTFGKRDKLTKHEKSHFPEQNTEDKSQELQILRENLMSDYNYGPMTSAEANFEARDATEKQDNWPSSENMVINLDPFNHNSENLETSIKSEQSEVDPVNNEEYSLNGEKTTGTGTSSSNCDLPPVPDHITSGSHFLMNDNQNSFSCSTCKKKFSCEEKAYYHQLQCQSIQRPHICLMCKKAFVRKRELDRHLVTHTGNKPHKCQKCSKSFGRKDKLIRHMRIHDVQKQHACNTCDATFNRRDSLIQHLRTHNKIAKEENE